MLLDAAHNPGGAEALNDTLTELREGRDLGLVLSFSSDKDAQGVARVFAGDAKRCWVVEMQNERGMQKEQLLGEVKAAGLTPVFGSLDDAFTQARDWAVASGGVVCLTGSVYFAGEVLAHLGGRDDGGRTA
jgi:dihydrofolate synthase/folylpolyglutamate synthase